MLRRRVPAAGAHAYTEATAHAALYFKVSLATGHCKGSAIMKLVKICATSLLLLPVAALAAGPFDGTWKVSLQHVQLSKKPIVLLLSGGDYTCKSCLTSATIKADGADHKVKGNPNLDTAAVTVVDANTVTLIDKLSGKTVQSTKWVIAADGKSLEREDTSLYGTEPSIFKIRLTRVADAPAGAHALSGSWIESKVLSVTGPGTVVTYGMTADGFSMSSNGQTYDAKFDDKTYPITGDPTKTMVNLKKISDSEVIETDSQKGQAVEVEHMTVSADGKTLHVVDTVMHGNRTTTFNMTKAP
jgi:hypothetical protein